MRTNPQAGWAGALRWRRPPIRLGRPPGIRNGGLLLVLVALAAVMALVDRPPQPGAGRSLPGVFQHLPPPVGITGLPPVADQPPTSAATGPAAAPAGAGERPASLDRAHPDRQHPRPTRTASSGLRSRASGSRPAGGGQGGTGTSRPPVASPPVTTPPVSTPPVTTPAARVRVPPVAVRVRPPSLLGSDLPPVRAQSPAVTVDVPAAEAARLRLG